ncbi:MAG: translational GTPase TypA [bacterium]|nr:translational GTPase TypA [bacterium]
MDIRNIAIIAHVDHGKTTLTDAIMRQTGAVGEGVSMDSNTLEKERGITIYAKNSSIVYKNTKINIVDTPGHADFGSEVERVLRSIDNVLLVVDAQEGPMPQTRYVLKKSIELGFKPIVVINKIDKPAADPDRTHDQVFDLFSELGATDAQLDFDVVYAIGLNGTSKRKLTDEAKDMTPLLDMILEKVAKASADESKPFRAQPFNLAYDNYLGRMCVARIYDGKASVGDAVTIKKADGSVITGKITKLFTFEGLSRIESQSVSAGDIVIIAGIPEIYIGDTICVGDCESLPTITIDPPTISLKFMVNSSPFAGREGEFVTSRQIRERLERELEVNVGLRVNFNNSTSGDMFEVSGRGELHIAILLENMRREGFELQVSQPSVIIKEVDGKRHEPFEEITVDVPSESQGVVIEKLGNRGAVMNTLEQHENTIRMVFEGPTRGLLGYRSEFIVDTRGEGILATRVVGFKPWKGDIARHSAGSMVSQVAGKALGYSLANLQKRGVLYIGPNTEVYEGMVIGDTSKGDILTVNPIKGKQLTNMRASGSDDNIQLAPPRPIDIESGLEIMGEDEYLEITPKSTRLRKQFLTEVDRNRNKAKKQG